MSLLFENETVKKKLMLLGLGCLLLLVVNAIMENTSRQSTTAVTEETTAPNIESTIVSQETSLTEMAGPITIKEQEPSETTAENSEAEIITEETSSTETIQEFIPTPSIEPIDAALIEEDALSIPFETGILASAPLTAELDSPAEEETIEAAPAPKLSAYNNSRIVDSVHTCKMKDLGVQFMCDLNWKVINEGRPEEAEIILSQDPLITIGWKKFSQNIKFLAQLNKFFFEETGQYQNGFSTEKVNFAGHNAVLVKGYDKLSPQAQRRDYFYLHGDQLVSISFSISPKEKWEEGKVIIQEVKNSFAALP